MSGIGLVARRLQEARNLFSRCEDDVADGQGRGGNKGRKDNENHEKHPAQKRMLQGQQVLDALSCLVLSFARRKRCR